MITRSIGFTIAIVGCLLLASGCANTGAQADALRLEESSLDLRAKQSRTLSADSEAQIVAATVDVLQDMEYNLDVIDPSLGVLTASKKVDADASQWKEAARLSVDVICLLASGMDCGLYGTMPDDQVISVTMVVLPSLARTDEFLVRVTAQYVEFNKVEMVRDRQKIDDEAVYQEIFSNLSKSLHLGEAR